MPMSASVSASVSVPELTLLLSHRVVSEHPDDESFLTNFGAEDGDAVFDPTLALNTNASFSQSQSQVQPQSQSSGVEPRLQSFPASGISPDITQSQTHLPQPLTTTLSTTGLYAPRGSVDDVLMAPAPPGPPPAPPGPPPASGTTSAGTLPLAPAETAPPTVGSLHSLNMAELLDPADRDVQAFAPKAPFFSISNTGRRRVAGGRNRVGTSNDRDDPGAYRCTPKSESPVRREAGAVSDEAIAHPAALLIPSVLPRRSR
jgi:hypothetical protein